MILWSITTGIIIEPPHCSQTSIMTSEMSSSTDIDMHRLMRLSLSLNSTVCFRLNSTTLTSLLHTLTLTSIDQYHPIIETYRFAIPRIRTDCICECDIASTQRCDPQQYSYTQCNDDKSSLCYRSYYGSQPATGCISHEHPAKLCCDIAFESAYKSISYLAVRIDQPDAFARFIYRSYSWDRDTGGRWSIQSTKMLRMPVDGLTHSG
jgi:hypothetical protein